MKKKTVNAFNRLNLILSSGLCVLSAKKREGSSIALLHISDFSNGTRVIFDIEEKKVISNRDNVEFSAADVEMISKALVVKKA